MEVQDLVNAFNSILEVGDFLDNSGAGIKAMTNGNHTTRELCTLELGQFLLYVGDGGAFFNDAQAGLVNLVLGDIYGQTPAWRLKSVAAGLDKPDPERNMTYLAFSIGDEALTRQQGTPSTHMRDLLISLYDAFGGLMVSLNENLGSRMRYNGYINSLKGRMNSSGFSASTPKKPVASGNSSGSRNTKPAEKKPAAKRGSVDITPYIPDNVSLTDTQKDYLRAIVELTESSGPVTSAEVASHMNKTTSAVSSAVRTLMKKGILEINDDAKIVPVKGGKKKTTAKAASATSTKKEVQSLNLCDGMFRT